SALKASAIRRASVVLPDPGGPQRIIECGLPDANATASGLPGARSWRWPTTSARPFGRMRPASGVAGVSSGERAPAGDLCAPRRHEFEEIGGQLGMALEPGQPDHAALSEVVGDSERREPAGVEPEADVGERRFLVLRRRAEPVEPAGRGQIAPVECLLDLL